MGAEPAETSRTSRKTAHHRISHIVHATAPSLRPHYFMNIPPPTSGDDPSASSVSASSGWSDEAIEHARSCAIMMRKRLHDGGAMGIRRSIRIRAERVSGDGAGPRGGGHRSDAKVVHFQRHGQGYHNLMAEVWRESGLDFDIDDADAARNPFVREEIVDAPLTLKGRAESEARRPQAAALGPELVVVSPLHRAIQTARLSFADHMGRDDVPWIAHEGCREELGWLVCNKRLPLSQTRGEFPGIDFSLVVSGEEDRLWNSKAREPPVAKSERIYDFLVNFIRHRPEREIAVVCHSAVLFNMANAVLDCGGDEYLTAWWKTSEIKSMRIWFEDVGEEEVDTDEKKTN